MHCLHSICFHLYYVIIHVHAYPVFGPLMSPVIIHIYFCVGLGINVATVHEKARYAYHKAPRVSSIIKHSRPVGGFVVLVFLVFLTGSQRVHISSLTEESSDHVFRV